MILQTKALELGEIEEFPFLDPPRADAVRDGYKTLFELGAIDEDNRLTDLGQQLGPAAGRSADRPHHPGRHAENCLHEVLIIASALEMQDPRERPVERKGSADEAHARFAARGVGLPQLSQAVGLLAEAQGGLVPQPASPGLPAELPVVQSHAGMARRASAVAGAGRGGRPEAASPPRRLRGHSSGACWPACLSNVAMRGDGYEYTVAGGGKCVLWPGSGVFAGKPKWIVAAEQVETSRRFLRTVARINPEWIEPLAGHLVSRSHSDPYWQRRGASVLCQERSRCSG